jgi:hypothetical protein
MPSSALFGTLRKQRNLWLITRGKDRRRAPPSSRKRCLCELCPEQRIRPELQARQRMQSALAVDRARIVLQALQLTEAAKRC